MTWAILSALAGHWRRNLLQLMTLIAGLALGTALWSGVQAINAEARAAYDRAAEVLGQDRLDRLVPDVSADAGAGLTVEEYAALRRAGWAVSPVLEGRLDGGLRVLGIEPLTLPQGAAMPGVPGLVSSDLAGFLAGAVVFAAPETLARPEVAKALAGLRVEAAPDLPPLTILADIRSEERRVGKEC